MLALDSPRWASLRHAYGAAGDVPAMLRAVADPVDDDVWEPIWSALCHQGTVYTASYAAVPLIRATIAAGWDEDNEVVYLLAAIAGVRRHAAVSNALEGLVDGFRLTCPGCAAELTIEWDDSAFQVTVDDPRSRRARRTLAVAAPESAPGRADPALPTWDEARVTAHLRSLADRAGQPDVVAQLIAWEGVATCPACEHCFALRPTLVAQAG